MTDHDPEAGREFAEAWHRLTAPSYTCSRCGVTSYNPNDVREGYCSNCHDWTREETEMRHKL